MNKDLKKGLKKSTAGKIGILLSALVLSITLTGCASNADTLMSPGPTVNSTQMPGTQLKDDIEDMLPGMSPKSSASPTSDMPVTSSNVPDTLDKSRTVSNEMEEAIDLLSEIDDASVVAIGNQALVGVEFESQYQGELDDRLSGMILARIQTISKGVNELFITSEAETYRQIEALSDSLETASSLSDVAARFTELTQSIQPYKK